MKRKILKAIAFIVAVALIAGIGAFANALVGNPISRHLAENAAERLVEEKHAGSDFYVEKIFYSFKDGFYHITLSSPSSPDSSFRILTDFFGRIKLNTYEDVIANKRNTADRIWREYRDAVDRVLESGTFPYDAYIAYGDIEFIDGESVGAYDLPYYAIVTDTLELDARYDIGELGKKAGHLVIYVYDEAVTAEKMAEILIGIKAAVNSSGVEFYTIDCVLEKPKSPDGSYSQERMEVKDFLCEDIYEKGMVERVAEANRKAEEYHAMQDELKQQEIEAYEKSLSEQAENN